MQNEAMEFLASAMKEGNGSFLKYDILPGRYGFNFSKTTNGFKREDVVANRGFQIALTDKYVKARAQQNYFDVTELGKSMLRIYQTKDQRTSIPESDDLLPSLTQLISTGHPTIEPDMNRKAFVIECLETVADKEEKCRLALEILSSTDTVELTNGILEQNKRLADLTEQSVTQNTKLARYTHQLVIVTAIMAVIALIPTVTEGVRWIASHIPTSNVIPSKAGQTHEKIGPSTQIKIQKEAAVLQSAQIANKHDQATQNNPSKASISAPLIHALKH